MFLHLWDTCYQARNRCALYQPTDNGPQDIQDRFEAFVDELDESPVPYIAQNRTFSITKQDVFYTIFPLLYQPQLTFPHLAATLAEAMAGNFTKLYEGIKGPKQGDSCPSSIPTTFTWFRDALNAISCGDGKSQVNLTIPAFLEHMERLKSDSPEFGARWSNHLFACKGWRVRPSYRFSGPWTSPEADASLVEGKPAAPLLLVSSLFDPVTPLVSAYEMSKGHPGSGVLVQENAGHASLLSPGKCREDFIKKYFETGELPPTGTTCTPECKPFQECSQMTTAALGFGNGLEPRRWLPLGLI